MKRVVIAGASAAGLAVAQTLREDGFSDSIIVIGEESWHGYDRPPLSKKLLGPDRAIELPRLIEASALAGLDLDMRLSTRVVAADSRRGLVSLSSGDTVAWDTLVVATGVKPVSLPGGGLTLRTVEDAVRLSSVCDRASRILIVGAGILGCELAALVTRSGSQAIMVDPQVAPMVDRFGAPVARRLFDLHAANGVEMHFGVSVARVVEGDSAGKGVDLVDGRRIDADAVVVAVGSSPKIGWLAGSGIPVQNGVFCDEYCRALPNVFAAGDVCNWFNPRFGRRMRIEHRVNATEQGMAVASNILHADRAFDPIPYFWTDQYDQRLQVHGLIGGDLEVIELSGNVIGSRGFVLAYVRAGIIEGVLGWNMAGGVLKARALIGTEARRAQRQPHDTLSFGISSRD